MTVLAFDSAMAKTSWTLNITVAKGTSSAQMEDLAGEVQERLLFKRQSVKAHDGILY